MSQSGKQDIKGKSGWKWMPPTSYGVSKNGMKTNMWKTELEQEQYGGKRTVGETMSRDECLHETVVIW